MHNWHYVRLHCEKLLFKKKKKTLTCISCTWWRNPVGNALQIRQIPGSDERALYLKGATQRAQRHRQHLLQRLQPSRRGLVLHTSIDTSDIAV